MDERFSFSRLLARGCSRFFQQCPVLRLLAVRILWIAYWSVPRLKCSLPRARIPVCLWSLSNCLPVVVGDALQRVGACRFLRRCAAAT